MKFGKMFLLALGLTVMSEVAGRFEEHVPCFTAEKVKRWKL